MELQGVVSQPLLCSFSVEHLPARSAHVSNLHVEEGQEGVTAEGAGGVEVGVVRRPASHDLLVVHQAVACLAARAAGDQQLQCKNTTARGQWQFCFLIF